MQVADFVDRYMPAYHAYLPGMYARGPTTARAGHVLVVQINETRSLTAEQPGPFREGDKKPEELSQKGDQNPVEPTHKGDQHPEKPSQKGPGAMRARPGASDMGTEDRGAEANPSPSTEALQADGREAGGDADGQWQEGKSAFEPVGKSVVAARLGLYVFASFALDRISRQRIFS